LGEKLLPVTLNGAPIGDFSILCHTAVQSGRGPFDTPINVQKAARELQKYIALVTGFSLPILADQDPLVHDCEIIVGESIRPESGAARPKKPFAADDYVIKTVGTKLVIDGGVRGVLYGVYSFIEEYLGVRYFTPDCELIADVPEIVIGNIDSHVTPPFEYRDICNWNAWDPAFSVKNKQNGTWVRRLDAEWGGGLGYVGGGAGFVHTFSHLLPEKKFFARHPEYFAVNDKGERDPSGICLTNDDAFAAALKTAQSWLKADPERGMLSVSINDGDVAYCNCPKCAAVRAEEGGESGGVLRFVNRFAEALEKQYPQLLVDTIIYGKVSEVPKLTRPRANVIVRVCGQSIRSHSVADTQSDPAVRSQAEGGFGLGSFAQKLDEWARVCNRIYVWDYPAVYSQINSIFPQFHTLLPNKKYFKEHNVKGVFINGTTVTCWFSELTVYLLAKAIWDPDMTEAAFDTHTDEFLSGYYGAGWRHIRAFIDCTRALTKGRIFTCHSRPREVLPPSDETAKKFLSFFDAAAEAATPTEKHRIDALRLSAEFWYMYGAMDDGYAAADENGRDAWVQCNRALYEGLQMHGITRITENTFLPVVKDFRQSPVEWSYWDKQCQVGDKNNFNYDRNIYALLVSDLEIGTAVNISFLLKTSNTNPFCFGRMLKKDGYAYITDGDGKKTPLVWTDLKAYKRVTLENVVITDLKRYAAREGKSTSNRDYEFIPGYKRGLIFCMESIDAGAYFMIKEIKIEPCADGRL
jgi:hypothetical protein